MFPACPKQVSIACASEDAASDGTDGDYVVQTTPSPLYPCLWVWEQGSSGMGKTFAMELGSIALSHVVTIEEEYIADGARRCVVLVNELPDCNLSNPGVCPTLLRFLILPAHRALCACMLPLCASFHMGPPGARQAVNVGRVLARRSTAALRKPLCAMQKTAEAMRDAAARTPGTPLCGKRTRAPTLPGSSTHPAPPSTARLRSPRKACMTKTRLGRCATAQPVAALFHALCTQLNAPLSMVCTAHLNGTWIEHVLTWQSREIEMLRSCWLCMVTASAAALLLTEVHLLICACPGVELTACAVVQQNQSGQAEREARHAMSAALFAQPKVIADLFSWLVETQGAKMMLVAAPTTSGGALRLQMSCCVLCATWPCQRFAGKMRERALQRYASHHASHRGVRNHG